MEFSLKEIIQLAIQGGVAIIMFIVWILTFRQANIHTDEALKTAKLAVDLANKTSQEAFDKHAVLSGQLIQSIKEDQEYKTLLAGILMRIEEKLRKPVVCPVAIGEDHGN